MFEECIRIGDFDGVSIGREGLKVSHLQFADDTLIVFKGSLEQLDTLKGYLLAFES